MRTFNSGFPAQPTTLYASTPVVPLAAQSQYSPDPMSGHRGLQPAPSNPQYAQPERGRPEPGTKSGKQKLNAKPVKGPNLNWTDLLPPPPPTTQLDVYDDEEEEEEGSGDEEWCPPLPERTYLMDGQQDEEVPPPPPRGEASSPATSYGQQSTATLTPSPRDEARLAGPSVSEDIPRLHQFEIPQLPRRLAIGPVPLPRPPTPPLTQSPTPNTEKDLASESGSAQRHGHKRNLSQTHAGSTENVSGSAAGKTRHTPGVGSGGVSTPPSQKARAKKKAKSNHYRRDLAQGDLPPPPEPPPC
uniref:Uncharacterized protein n=1 Tax=Callorhinchus milii TaxID=7868 RepID=A0A4W3H5A3_CALMI